VLAASWLWLFAYPIPDSKITITTGAADGACYRHAQRYAELLAEYGVTPVIQTSAGF